MEIMVPRLYQVNIDEEAHAWLNEQGHLTDMLSEITYLADGGDVYSSIYLIRVTNKSVQACTKTLWTIEPEDFVSDDVTIEYLYQVDYEVQDMGIYHEA